VTSAHDPTSGSARRDQPDQSHSEEQPRADYPTGASSLAAPPEPGSPEQDASQDDEWAVKGGARGVRLGLPLAGLLAVALVATGFWGGAALEKSHGVASVGGAGGFAGRIRGGGGGFSFGGGANAAAPGTAGTISVIDGNTLYVLSSRGALVKVTVTKSTAITRNANTTAGGLRPGDAVTVQGATSANGNVSASSISTTAPGVSSSIGIGFGAGGAVSGRAATTGGKTAAGGTTASSGG
jgi:hypothetical protein